MNIRHGEALADRFRERGIPARSVSGQMSKSDRQECLAAYARGDLRVLCACDLLNEGWDCPDVEVLLMARPTLSKVIYLQQLGRGTRKSPGKDCLVVFDFVDNASRYNQSLSLHRILGINQYRAGSLVLAPADLLNAEGAAFAMGEPPTHILPVELWARDFQEIDVFNWQEVVSDMISVSDLEVELAATEGRIRSAVERGLVLPDHTIPIGERTYYYFSRDRAEEIRQKLGLPKVDDESIRTLFLDFLAKMDMSSSYKPVLLRSIIEHLDEKGRARIDEVACTFGQFYIDRQAHGLPVEQQSMRMFQVSRLSREDIRTVMLGMPFRKFEQRKFLAYDKMDLSYIRFHTSLWRQLSSHDRASIIVICDRAIAKYFERSTTW